MKKLMLLASLFALVQCASAFTVKQGKDLFDSSKVSPIKGKDGSLYTGSMYVLTCDVVYRNSGKVAEGLAEIFASAGGLDLNDIPALPRQTDFYPDEKWRVCAVIDVKDGYFDDTTFEGAAANDAGSGGNTYMCIYFDTYEGKTYMKCHNKYPILNVNSWDTADNSYTWTWRQNAANQVTGTYIPYGEGPSPEPMQAVISAIVVTDAEAEITATNVTDGATYELIRCDDLGVAEPKFSSLTPAVTATAAEGKVELVDPAKPAEKAFYKVTVPEK